MAIFDAEDVRKRLDKLPGWTDKGGAISRQFTFRNFPDAIAFVVRVGFGAEAADHHPDLLVNYKRVMVTYTTHSEGGLTAKDFDGAAMAAAVAGEMGG